MERVQELFLQAVRAAMAAEQVCWQQPLTPEQWDGLFCLARTHHMLPMVLEAVHTCAAFAGADPAMIGAVRQESRILVTGQTRKTLEFLALYRRLLAADAAPLVVKGLVCRSLYPVPDQRISGDEDLLVSQERYAPCRRVLEQSGLVCADAGADARDASELPFAGPGSPLYLELHRQLFPPESEAYGELNRFFDDAHARAVTVQILDTPVRTLEPTDHMLYLILHAFKHFLHSGCGMRQVCDVVMFANAWGHSIRWDGLLEACTRVRAQGFARALLRIGREQLTLDPQRAAAGEAWLAGGPDPAPLLEDILRAGVYGNADSARLHSGAITVEAVAAEKTGRAGKGGVTTSLFPPARMLEDRYPYLKRYPWLVGAAWLQRVVDYGTKNRAGDAAESLRLGQQRVRLLQQYGILEE